MTLQLDLASGQDGMGAGLGLDMQMDPNSATGEGEFHGLGLRCVLCLPPPASLPPNLPPTLANSSNPSTRLLFPTTTPPRPSSRPSQLLRTTTTPSADTSSTNTPSTPGTLLPAVVEQGVREEHLLGVARRVIRLEVPRLLGRRSISAFSASCVLGWS